MEEIELTMSDFVISTSVDTEMKIFLEEGVSNFYSEVIQYINENSDLGMLHYANENTLASLFYAGNLRRNNSLTGLQEYGTFYTKENKEVKGRPDIFMKAGDKAIWIECKYQRNIVQLGEDHWDVPGWLKWDAENAYNQVEVYYNSEAKQLNDSYKKRYLVTLYFKLIKENTTSHLDKVKNKLGAVTASKFDRAWYYQVCFFLDSDKEGKSLGLEVYGTCSTDLAVITR